MKRAHKLFILSLFLAIALHLLFPLGVWWFLRLTPHTPVVEPVTMVHLVTLPPQPEPEPAKPDALAEANHIAKSNTQSEPDTLPNIPPPPAAAAEVANLDPTPPQPKPIAKPAQPKPLAKKAPAKPLAIVKSATPSTEKPEKEEDANKQPDEGRPPQEKPYEESPPQEKPREAKPYRPSAQGKSQTASTPQPSSNIPLFPSIESLSQWDRNRRFETRSTTRDEEVVDLNTRQTRYLSYFTKVKQRIEWGWVYPAEAKRDKLSGNVGLIFTIQPDGELLDVQITRSSGLNILDEAALAGVRKAAPFGNFPADWSIKKLTIRATFEYIRRELLWEK